MAEWEVVGERCADAIVALLRIRAVFESGQMVFDHTRRAAQVRSSEDAGAGALVSVDPAAGGNLLIQRVGDVMREAMPVMRAAIQVLRPVGEPDLVIVADDLRPSSRTSRDRSEARQPPASTTS